MDRPGLVSSVEEFANAGERAGLSIAEMIRRFSNHSSPTLRLPLLSQAVIFDSMRQGENFLASDRCKYFVFQPNWLAKVEARSQRKDNTNEESIDCSLRRIAIC